MRFAKDIVESWSKFFDVERPYVKSSEKISEGFYEIPSTLIGLAQIQAYYTNPEFRKLSQIDIHNSSKNLVPRDSNKWLSEVDRLIDALKKFVPINDNDSDEKELILKQICTKSDLLKKAVLKEKEAIDAEEIIFWRFSTTGLVGKDGGDIAKYSKKTYKQDIAHKKHAEKYEDISFSDSLLAGYLNDGMGNSELGKGVGNLSACTLIYLDTHMQAITAKEAGFIYDVGYYAKEKIKLENLNADYHKYFKSLNDHQLYGIQMSHKDAHSLVEKGYLRVPDIAESYAACFGRGEKFHPKICPELFTFDYYKNLELKNVTLYTNCSLDDVPTTQVIDNIELGGNNHHGD